MTKHEIRAIFIHEIAKQYKEHNDHIPYWLHIGDIDFELDQEPTPKENFFEECPYYEPDMIFDGENEYDVGCCRYKPTPTASYCKLEDCISRDEVLKLMKDNWHSHNGDWAMQESMDDIRALPSVDPKAKTGHWIYTDNYTWCCSECGGNPHRGTGFTPNKDGMKMQWKFCNLCGTRMIEPQESEET